MISTHAIRCERIAPNGRSAIPTSSSVQDGNSVASIFSLLEFPALHSQSPESSSGADDERDLFPEALRIIEEAQPTAVMLENVAGFASSKFSDYRTDLFRKLNRLGYRAEWQMLNASDFGVPQLRPRFVLVGLREKHFNAFGWPLPTFPGGTVGTILQDLMAENGWPGALKWVARANGIAPTVVGGSKKHGGPDLGPTRAREQWRRLGVDGLGIADAAPDRSFPVDGLPRLTARMVARIQSFPDDWKFSGRKTAVYRQSETPFRRSSLKPSALQS